MRLAVAGVTGRMGHALVRAVAEHPLCVLAGGLCAPHSTFKGADIGEVAGLPALGIMITDDADALMRDCDGVIDFSIPAASLALVEKTLHMGRAYVIGTTGFDEAGEHKLRQAALQATIVKSGNMSLGITLLAHMVAQAAKALGEDFDIEILEMHHRNKVDAPSGTAFLLGEAAAAGRGISLGQHAITAREGQTGKRPAGDIGFATLRGGSVIGDHSVFFAGPSERIELSHRAEARDVFAKGAVKAALWCRGKAPGLYTMTDVLELES